MLYYQYKIYFDKNELKDATEKIIEAKKYSEISDSIYLMYCAYRLTEYKDDSILEQIIHSIINNKLKFDSNSVYEISFKELHLLRYINLTFYNSNTRLFDDLISYSLDSIYGGKKNKFEVLYNSIKYDTSNNVDVLNYLLENKENLNSSLLLNIYRALAFLCSDNVHLFFKNFNEYLEVFKDSNAPIKIADIHLISRAIKFYSDSNAINKGIVLCDLVDNKLSNSYKEDLKFESLIIYYWYALLYFSLGNKHKSIFYAEKTISIIDTSKEKRTSIIDEKGLKYVSNKMNQIIYSSTIKIPIVGAKKYGRNDRLTVKYQDGLIKEDKYKKLEPDILAERCVIIK